MIMTHQCNNSGFGESPGTLCTCRSLQMVQVRPARSSHTCGMTKMDMGLVILSAPRPRALPETCFGFTLVGVE